MFYLESKLALLLRGVVLSILAFYLHSVRLLALWPRRRLGRMLGCSLFIASLWAINSTITCVHCCSALRWPLTVAS